MTDRYDITGKSEGEFQPGSDKQVLLNKRGITDAEQMELEEFDALVLLQERLFEELSSDQAISARDLCYWHKLWLGELYEWAGAYRTVNMSKGGFMFAAAHLITTLMQTLEEKYLTIYTPCNGMTEEQLIEAMAVCHVEFILVHPFREGNGRLGRVLTTIMALQAGMHLLDFAVLEQDKERYIRAIHAGHNGDYQPMKLIFCEVLALSLQESDLS